MTTLTTITTSQKILLAAHSLSESGETPFSIESLVVAAWNSDPLTFGLRTFAELYPDSNKIIVNLYGPESLTARGWMKQVGPRLYTLTEKGEQVARELLAREPETSKELSREQIELLEHLLQSSALSRMSQHLEEELTFVDACRFWRITDCPGREEINRRLEEIKTVLMEVVRQVGTTEAVLRNGRLLTCAEILDLIELNTFLESRFSQHLNLLRNRRRQPASLRPCG